MTTRLPLRYVEGTNERYRYLNKDELIEGTKALMFDIDRVDDRLNVRTWSATTVTLDANPVVERYREPHVHYHCVRPAWEGQCFVPVATFTTGYADRNDFPVPGPRHEYWVPTR